MLPLLLLPLCLFTIHAAERPLIKIWEEDPRYWALDGEPILLIGGSVEDNLFQIENLEAHLDLLVDSGGNYVRGSLSARDAGNDWFAHQLENGLYDLERMEGPYWEKLERFFRLTAERGIVVQVEVFDRFDYAREPWQLNPFNPKNNINYTAETSVFETEYALHPGQKENPFFRSVPKLENNRELLEYQHAYVDRLLEVAAPYGHILYCISNETNEDPAWGAYWAHYIRDHAGKPVAVTEMWDDWDLMDEEHRATIDHPETYSFLDASQNNHQQHQTHFDNLQAYRAMVAEARPLCPINCVKIYGAHEGRYGSDRDGIERFWRLIIGGVATARFHRPPSGLGLSWRAQRHLYSVRQLEAAGFDFCSGEVVNDRLGNRAGNEAYARQDRNRSVLVFFPDGGNVTLSVGDNDWGRVRWLNLEENTWLRPERIRIEGNAIVLKTPERMGYWAALVDIE